MQSVMIRRLAEGDVSQVLDLMDSIECLALCDWENEELFRAQLANRKSVMLAAVNDKKLVGALVGGAFGKRGMICHAAVAPDLQLGNGIGTKLVHEAIAQFRQVGVEKVHLIVTAGNDDAVRYWTRRGFTPDSQCLTLERDVADEELSADSVSDFSHAQCDCLSRLVQEIQASGNEWLDAAVLEESISDENCLLLGREDPQGRALGIAGIFGFRAQISYLTAASAPDFQVVLNAALDRIRTKGVRRIHARVDRQDPSLPHWYDAGFSEQQGETTLEFALR